MTIESLDDSLALRASVKKAKWEEVCSECFASYSMHLPDCPLLKKDGQQPASSTKRKPRKEKQRAE